MAVGALGPYCGLRLFSMWRKKFIPPKVMMLGCSVGSFVGGMYGIAVGNIHAARKYLELTGSPLATEIRYQLRKINSSHPYNFDIYEPGQRMDAAADETNKNHQQKQDYRSNYEQYGKINQQESSFSSVDDHEDKQTWS